MNQSIYRFVFRCSGCRKLYSISDKYEENKTYKCPGCKITSIIKRKDVKYEAKSDPFTFQCPHCHEIGRTYDFDFQPDVDGYDTWTVDCPNCKKQVVIKEECAYHYFAQRT